MTWLKLTAPSGAPLVVNFDLVQWFEMSLCVPKANTAIMMTGDPDMSLYVRESLEEIQAMLPFGAQPVPGNYRTQPDG